MKVDLCKTAHCWHAAPSRLARAFAALTIWVLVRCCVCKRYKVRLARSPHVKAP